MKLIAGLGNPGNRYRPTRHNSGYLILDRLGDRSGIGMGQQAFGALFGRGNIAGCPALLVKPQEYMNRSGEAVKKFFDYYRISIKDTIVVHDDLDLPFGTIRLKAGGGHAGHRGLISVIEDLGDADFSRVRFGIGRPERSEMAESHVLSTFSGEELSRLPPLIDHAADMLTEMLARGIQAAMCKYHGKTINNFEEV